MREDVTFVRSALICWTNTQNGPWGYSGYGFSQWETTLHYNVGPNLLSSYPEWSMKWYLKKQRRSNFAEIPFLFTARFLYFQLFLSSNDIQNYSDVIMGAIASQIISLAIVYSTVYTETDQRKQQSSASLANVQGIHRGPVNSTHEGPVTRKMFPFDDVIMERLIYVEDKPQSGRDGTHSNIARWACFE